MVSRHYHDCSVCLLSVGRVMRALSLGLKRLVVLTASVLVVSVAYYFYAYLTYAPVKENETFLAEIGEAFGEVGLWLLCFIYLRTALKLLLGKGAIARRLLPDYSLPVNLRPLDRIIPLLDRTHIYVGMVAVVVILLHIGLADIPMQILFFPAVLALVIWQGLFGLFITWRYTPAQIRKFSYLVHAQLLTGIMIGVFAYFGHLLID